MLDNYVVNLKLIYLICQPQLKINLKRKVHCHKKKGKKERKAERRKGGREEEMEEGREREKENKVLGPIITRKWILATTWMNSKAEFPLVEAPPENAVQPTTWSQPVRPWAGLSWAVPGLLTHESRELMHVLFCFLSHYNCAHLLHWIENELSAHAKPVVTYGYHPWFIHRTISHTLLCDAEWCLDLVLCR